MTTPEAVYANRGRPDSDGRRLGNRSSYLLLSLLLSTITLIGVVWWPLVEDYLNTFDPRHPWWVQFDWLLIGIFLAMSILIVWRADLGRDLGMIGVGFVGGLVIESWGTQTSLWTYYTLERPPLWILPAWPVAALAIDRLVRILRAAFERLEARVAAGLYLVVFSGFAVLMLDFVWPTRDRSLTVAASALCAFLILTPRQPRLTLATFAAGSVLGFFLELWGTTRACWTYYTFETPPAFAVLAHGMAAVAFWRAAAAFEASGASARSAWRRIAAAGGLGRRSF